MIAQQVLVLFVLIAVGFICGKKGIKIAKLQRTAGVLPGHGEMGQGTAALAGLWRGPKRLAFVSCAGKIQTAQYFTVCTTLLQKI